MAFQHRENKRPCNSREQRRRVLQADKALQCFLEVIAQIAEKRTEIILRRKLPRLFMAYPNYRLALGFGLHHGWAIEGSLGSIHKVSHPIQPHSIPSRLTRAVASVASLAHTFADT